jgi:hypothetical protein
VAKRVAIKTKATENEVEKSLILKGWSTFCENYKPIEVTGAEKAVFEKIQFSQIKEKSLLSATRECVRS